MADTKTTPASEEVIEGVVDTQSARKTSSKSKRKADKDTASSPSQSSTDTTMQKSRWSGLLGGTALVVAMAGLGLSVWVMSQQDSLLQTGIEAYEETRQAEQVHLTGLSDDITALTQQHADQMRMLAVQNESISALQSDVISLQAQLEDMRINRDELAAQLAALEETLEMAAKQPASGSADFISRGWLAGLLAASQFGQDLGAWQQRLTTARTPQGGWGKTEAQLIAAIKQAEVVSHHQLILAAVDLAETRQLQPPQETARTELQGLFSWVTQLVSLEKLSDEEDQAYRRFIQAVDSGDLVAVQSRFADISGTAQPDSQRWSERVESRLQLDRLILQHLGQPATNQAETEVR